MIVRADRYDWRSLDIAPVGEDVTLLVREGRGRRYRAKELAGLRQ